MLPGTGRLRGSAAAGSGRCPSGGVFSVSAERADRTFLAGPDTRSERGGVVIVILAGLLIIWYG